MNRSPFSPIVVLRTLLRPLDPILLLALAALLGYAYVLMRSASPNRLDAQGMHVLIALGAMWAVALLTPAHLLKLARPLYVFGVLLLLGVEFFGEVSKGAQRWLDIGITRIQPSELMKIAMPLMLAWYFQQHEGQATLRHFLFAALLLVVPVGLIVVQPDLGTSLLVAASGVYVIFFAGLSWRLIIPVLLVGVLAIGSIVSFGDTLCQPEVDWQVLREYQKQRVCMLFDPTRDPLGKGFHIIQSTIAIGSGGLSGKGWMDGTQTHLAFLPERHTDFILAVLAEEFGLVGIGILLAIYLVLLLRGFTIASFAPTHATRLLAGAITMILFTYAFVNMGMVSGILPVVGVPLPFISYGGTALVTLCVGIGILMSIQASRLAGRN